MVPVASQKTMSSVVRLGLAIFIFIVNAMLLLAFKKALFLKGTPWYLGSITVAINFGVAAVLFRLAYHCSSAGIKAFIYLLFALQLYETFFYFSVFAAELYFLHFRSPGVRS